MLWVHASNAARFEQSFCDIADCIKIPRRQDPKANIFKLVHEWLRDSKDQWLLVLDNVDDARFLDSTADNRGQTTDDPGTASASRPLRTYLPHCQRGSILITSRNKGAALTLVENRDIIPVEPMDKVQSLALLERKLGKQGSHVELAALLEYMPLAIVQAAAYISQRAPRYSVTKYLEDCKKSERKMSSLLNHNDSQLRRDWEANNSIIITWQISFEHIQQIQPSAADLLSLMSFFDRQGIPEALIRSRTKRENGHTSQKAPDDDGQDSHSDDASQSSADDNAFEDDILTLRNFHFISMNTDGTNFEMHRLVQLATRTWLTAHCKLEQWKQQFISNLCAEFPRGEFENWAVCHALFPHAKSAAGQHPEEMSSQAEWATLLHNAAWYASEMGNFAEAETLAVKSMETRRRVLGQEHEHTLWSIAIVGQAYARQGRYKKAETLQAHLVETCKRVFGEEQYITQTCITRLASNFYCQERLEEAEELQVQVLENYKRDYGEENHLTLNAMTYLAATLNSQGRLKDAEELQVHALEISRRVHGNESPETLTCMNNLANTLCHLGKWKESEEVNIQALEIGKRVRGEEHPSHIDCMNILGLTFAHQGRLEEAVQMHTEVLQLSKRVLGDEHPDTLAAMNNLAITLRKNGLFAEAVSLLEAYVGLVKRIRGDHHWHTENSTRGLKMWQMEDAQRAEAEARAEIEARDEVNSKDEVQN